MFTPLEEQETIIRIGRTDDFAIISTSDTTMMTKCDKLVANSDEWKFVGQHLYGSGDVAEKEYACPKRFVSFRTKTVKRNFTEEQRKALSERAKRMRNS